MYFLNYSFKFHPHVRKRSHGLLMMSMTLTNIAIFNLKGSDYRCIFSLISKIEAINLMKNATLTEKSETLSNQAPREFWSCKFTSHSN